MSHGAADGKTRESFGRHLLRAAPVLVLVTAAVFILSQTGAMRGFETAALDVWLQVKEPRPVRDLVIVTIDDDDYRELFGRRSPLDPPALQRIVEAVAAGGPRVIGVDLDTSDGAWSSWTPPTEVPTVWAGEGIPDETQHAEGGHGPHTVFRPGAVLGRETLDAGGQPRTGLALTPQDPDGVVRRYIHELPVVDGKGARSDADTFAFAVVRALPGGESRHATHGAIVLNFAGDRYAFPNIAARDLLAAAGGEGWRTASPLRDKIVLIGGTYRAARDEYVTPVGVMPGVHIAAQAIVSELHGGGIREVNHSIMTLLEIASGVLLVWINYRFRPGTALALSLVAMPVLTLTGSALTFSSLAYWFNFVPALLGVWIHELIDHAHEYKSMHDELHRLREIVAAGAMETGAGASVPDGDDPATASAAEGDTGREPAPASTVDSP